MSRNNYIDQCGLDIEQFKGIAGKIILKYIRENNRLTGVVLACKLANGIRIGLSCCHPIRDKFNKTIGIKLALENLHEVGEKNDYIPRVNINRHRLISGEVDSMKLRALRYFKI